MNIHMPAQIEGLETVNEFNIEIMKHSEELINMAVKIIPFGDISARDMIDTMTVERYLAVNRSILLAPKIKNYSDYVISKIGMIDAEIDMLMLSWIALGSALEASLQIFLTAFKHNYDDKPAQKWEVKKSEELDSVP